MLLLEVVAVLGLNKALLALFDHTRKIAEKLFHDLREGTTLEP
jgi:hypothetical protein